MSAFQVTTDKEQKLSERMAALGVRESDLQESFVRSGGPGGQNVNKTSTCVMLTHLPTGLQVKSQATRQQGANRFLAKVLLLDKLEAQQKARREVERARLAKIRRQKRRPSARAQQRRLQGKAHHSVKKEFRRRIFSD